MNALDLDRITRRFKVVRDRTDEQTGSQVIIRFGNGYGASIIRGPYSYGGPDGLFELAVMAFKGENDDCGITYNTPITDDVLGHLTLDDVVTTAEAIADLPAVGASS